MPVAALFLLVFAVIIADKIEKAKQDGIEKAKQDRQQEKEKPVIKHWRDEPDRNVVAAQGDGGRWLTDEEMEKQFGERFFKSMPYARLDLRGKGKYRLPSSLEVVHYHSIEGVYGYSEWIDPNGNVAFIGNYYEVHGLMPPAEN